MTTPNSRRNIQIDGVYLGDIVNRAIERQGDAEETDEQAATRRSVDAQAELDAAAERRAERERAAEAAHAAGNTPEGGREAGRRARLW
jgi:hypothetical protein